MNLAVKRIEDPNAKLEDIPTPSNYDCLVEYNAQKAQFDIEWVEYERKVKLATHTYPDENKKVFATVLDCISEGSIQELKRHPEGEKYFNEHESYNLFKLAVAQHAYLAPAISSAAVARAKEDFEGLRQNAEDSFTDHFNEFRRRYEVLVKKQEAKNLENRMQISTYETYSSKAYTHLRGTRGRNTVRQLRPYPKHMPKLLPLSNRQNPNEFSRKGSP